MEKKVTFYRFLSEVRAFLSRLVTDPVNAMPSKFLKDNDFSKKKLVNELIKRGVLVRNEKILTPDKTGEKDVKYSVQYKIKRKDFETKIKRIYSKFFEKNVPEKSKIDESVGEMIAYHGSPCKFRKFQEKYISTTYYGWGTYVTADKSCGEFYAKKDGYLYEVEIPDDNGKNYFAFCDDKSTQNDYERIYEILINAFPDYEDAVSNAVVKCEKEGSLSPIFTPTGIEGVPANAKKISKIFDMNGIVGIKVDVSCYVVFDTRNIKILNRVQLQECDGTSAGAGVGDAGGGSGLGGTSEASVGELTQRGDVGFDTVIGMMTRPGYLGDRKKKKNEPKPENILGKDIKEGKRPRRVFITEEQLRMLMETDISSVAPDDGQLGPVRPGCMTFKKKNGKPDNSAFEREPGFSVRRLK